jgi:hypothetical protein
LPADNFAHVLELHCDALIGGHDGIERVADLSRDSDLRARQAHREIPGLHRLQRAEQFVQIEFPGFGSRNRRVPVRSFLTCDARTWFHEISNALRLAQRMIIAGQANEPEPGPVHTSMFIPFQCPQSI